MHHGINFTYLDKNFGEFLIIWDRLFNTYAEEEEKVVYGMYNPPNTWNPITINFHYYQLLWKDAMAAPYWVDKFKIWFMPLGWRPRGLSPKPELKEVTQQNQVRLQTKMFWGAKPYLILHILLGILLMMVIIDPQSPWGTAERWVGSFLLWHMIINWSGIMESKEWLFLSEVVRLIITGTILIYFSDAPVYAPVNLLWIILSFISALWTTRYFRIYLPLKLNHQP